MLIKMNVRGGPHQSIRGKGSEGLTQACAGTGKYLSLSHSFSVISENMTINYLLPKLYSLVTLLSDTV